VDPVTHRTAVVVFLAAVSAEAAWLGLCEIEAWGLAGRLGAMQHMIAMVGGTAPLVVAWWAARRWRLRPGAELTLLLLAALVIRAVLLPQPLEGSKDASRYLWDGRVQDAGINPYRYVPEDPALADLRDDELYPGVYKKYLPTCYLPVAQGWFWLAYRIDPHGFTGLKIILLLHELVAIALLWLALRRRGIPGAQAVILALSPLCAVQFMVGLHLDALYLPWLALALWAHRERPGLAGAALMIAALVRPVALAALPALLLFRPRREAAWMLAGAAAAGVVCVLPYADAGTALLGSIPMYLGEWEFNAPVYGVLKYALAGNGELARLIGFGLGLALAMLCWTRRGWTPAARFLGAAGVYYLCSSMIYPWYLVMLLVPWARVGGWTPLMLGAIVALSEAHAIPHTAGTPWRMGHGWIALEVGLLALFLGLDRWAKPRSS
jgi:alpha-1,6-mannosyltransferase